MAGTAVLTGAFHGFLANFNPLWHDSEETVRLIYLAPGGRPDIKLQGERIQNTLRDRTGVPVKMEFRESSNDMKIRADQVRQIAKERPLGLLTAHPDMALLAVKENLGLQIVTGTRNDPRQLGLRLNTPSRRHPVTGYSNFVAADEKRLAILKELAPGIRRVGLMMDDNIAAERKYHNNGRLDYRLEGVEVVPVAVVTLDDAIEAVRNSRAMGLDGWYVREVPSYYNPSEYVHLVRAMNDMKLPAIYERMGFVNKGGLVAYEAVLVRREELWNRALQLLVEGVSASDIPFSRPHHFYLVYNTDTATALGIQPKNDFLLRVDQIYPCAVRPPMRCSGPPLY